MPETAVEQLNRIVQLVAELSRVEELPVARVAERFGVAADRIFADLRTLTEAADDPEATWLLSLQVIQEGDAVAVSSRGPYRRPIRFTAEELLALRLGIALETSKPSAALRELGAFGAAEPGPGDALQPSPLLHGEVAEVVNIARVAAAGRRRLRICYAAGGATEPADRVIQPHVVIHSEGRFYVVAWCEAAVGWRFFRADRVVEAAAAGGAFEPRDDVPAIERAADLFRAPAEAVDEVVVRFSPTVARWIAERYPEARPLDDGRVEVTLPSASVDWAIGTVLQYGAEAEIVTPAVYREAIRRAVGAVG
ncbi:MAG: helix-turn-helix transcriptional regulator [Gemmatimonadales bacterium]